MTSEQARDSGQAGWHSYRCPVCGHTDGVDGVGESAAMLACAHCGTDLEVAARTPDEAAAVVRVAARWRRAH